MPDFIVKICSKGSNRSYNVTKFNLFNIKSKNQLIIEDVEEEEIEVEEDECVRSELEYKPVIVTYIIILD